MVTRATKIYYKDGFRENTQWDQYGKCTGMGGGTRQMDRQIGSNANAGHPTGGRRATTGYKKKKKKKKKKE